MAIHKLTASKIDALIGKRGNGWYGDGGCLYLQIDGGSASWIFRYIRGGKETAMGFGPVHTIGLDKARDLARDAREILINGGDPKLLRDAERTRKALEAAKAVTFDQAAEAYIAAHEVEWRNPIHRKQWRSTLATYASPIIGALPVAAVDTDAVMKVLEPIWTSKPETAGRVRGRIESILAWATVRKLRQGDNPARWAKHLDQLLPARGKVHKVKHHTALDYNDIHDFMLELRAQEGIGARALEFVILTAVRTGDIIGNDREDRPPMRWGHVNLDEEIWTIPAIKTGVEHIVPLNDAAVAVLEGVKKLDLDSDIVFPSPDRPGEPLSNNAMLALLRRMKVDATTHGMRATFRSWAGDRTNFEKDVIESALAHSISNKVEAAYRRSDFFEKRRRLMDEWAKYCNTPRATPSGKVVTGKFRRR